MPHERSQKDDSAANAALEKRRAEKEQLRELWGNLSPLSRADLLGASYQLAALYLVRDSLLETTETTVGTTEHDELMKEVTSLDERETKIREELDQRFGHALVIEISTTILRDRHELRHAQFQIDPTRYA